MAVKCLWNWLNPVNLPPGCHCAQSANYLQPCKRKCEHYTAAVKETKWSFMYNAHAIRTVKVVHNKKVIR